MVKRGPLGTAEIFYVKAHCGEYSEKSIAEKLDRSVQAVSKVVKKIKAEAQKNPEESNDDPLIETENLESIDASKMFVSEHGATVMTPHASMLGDDMSILRDKNHESRNTRCTVPIKK